MFKYKNIYKAHVKHYIKYKKKKKIYKIQIIYNKQYHCKNIPFFFRCKWNLTSRMIRDLYTEMLILTCSNSLALGRQAVMLHPESVLALIRQIGGVAREWVIGTRGIRRVRNLPLDILVDLRLLRLRRSSVCVIIRPVGSSCLAVLSRFIAVDGDDVGSSRHRGHVIPRPLPRRVRRGDAVDDRRLVVARNVRHDLLTAPCRAPVSEVRKASFGSDRSL